MRNVLLGTTTLEIFVDTFSDKDYMPIKGTVKGEGFCELFQ